MPGWHDVACVAHIHSAHSDGTATIAEIAAAARDADADAALVTDHDTLAALRAGEEGWQGDVLVLVGHEISPRGGHLLTFGLEREVQHTGRSPSEICAAVNAAGGFGFAAHPFSSGSRMAARIGRPHPWPLFGGACSSLGIELWSLVTDAAEACATPRQLLRLVRAPERVLDGPSAHHLRQWDLLCRDRRVPAIGGLDAHQSGVRLAGRAISPMPNARWFRLLQTNLLLDRPLTGAVATDRAAVYDAMRAGRCLLVRRDLGDARGFRLWAQGPAGSVAMGGEATGDEWTVHVRLPQPARLRLVRDGRPVVERWTAALDQRVESGVHRVEAHVPAHGGERTWIISNPLYLRAWSAVSCRCRACHHRSPIGVAPTL